MATPNLNLPTVPSGQTSISQAFNEAMQVLDAVAQLIALDKDLTAPPATTNADAGKCWIVGASATGAWAGYDRYVALCTAANVWRMIQPRQGWRAYVVDENKDYRYNGTAWAAL